MEPAQDKIVPRNALRYKLILGKLRVAKVTEQTLPTGKAYKVDLQIEGRVMFSFVIGGNPDVREGDILTLYTEVLVNAKSVEAPIQ